MRISIPEPEIMGAGSACARGCAALDSRFVFFALAGKFIGKLGRDDNLPVCLGVSETGEKTFAEN
jgi:hypothetical protein